MRTRLFFVAVVAWLVILTGGPLGHVAARNAQFVVIDILGTQGGIDSQATAINDRGQVIGFKTIFVPTGQDGCCHPRRAFLWDDGVITDLGSLTGSPLSSSFPVAINKRGQVIGESDSRGFLWDDGVMVELSAAGAITLFPLALNDRGQVVGEAFVGSLVTHAFLWQRGVTTDLGTLPGYSTSVATHINNRGQVAGSSTLLPVGNTHAFFWADGAMTDLGTLGGENASPLGIKTLASGMNDRGQVVGFSLSPSGNYHAFLWANGTMTDLGTLPGDDTSLAMGINNRGQVVGVSVTSGQNFAWHAFIWENGVMIDLGTLGPLGSSATGINEHGQVFGETFFADGTHAFLWEHGVMTDLGTLGGFLTVPTDMNNRGQVVGVSNGQAVLWTKE
jgi:probable HAF family extracellular repeat protein